MHPNVGRFIDQFEKEADEKGLYRRKIGKAECIFLEQVWGPIFQFNYDGLRAEYPLKDFKGGDRFVDFVYKESNIRLVVEIDGFTTHARDISPGEFDDHLMRQNDLVLGGWMVLRFSAHQVEKRPQQCQRQLQQSIGHWWTLMHQIDIHTASQKTIWGKRKNSINQIAISQNGIIRPKDVSLILGIPLRTAQNWLKRLMQEGEFSPLIPKLRTSGYRMATFTPEVRNKHTV